MNFLAAGILICAYGAVMADDIPAIFKSNEVVPDVLDKAPNKLLSVNFNDISVQFGKELTPTQVKDIPTLSWDADPSALYTVCMSDPDAPSRKEPKFREFLHWLVVNVPGTNINQGETLAAYVGSGPPKDTGLHRYVLLVYKQSDKMDTSKLVHVANNSRDGRLQFSIKHFAELQKLGDPIAGNMYQAQYDDYVPNISKQLGGGR